jgi:4,5-dihydroxyphthalate decarboxylase
MNHTNTGVGISHPQLAMALNPVDHVRDVLDGTVAVGGISITPLQLPVEEIFYRFTAFQEWDVSEMSLAKFVSLTAAGDAPMIGLPVFTSRAFRHSAIYVRAQAGIATVRDLEGRTVGVPEWAQTAGVWVRGMMAEQYGVDLKKIRWVQSGVNEFGRQEKVDLSLPHGVEYSAHQSLSLNELLLSGEIDAVITARPPRCFATGGAKRLFPDFHSAEVDYFRETGIFPIMHLAVLKRSTFERHRWAAQNLVKAFDQARERSLVRLLDITASPVPMAWATALAANVFDQFGGDPWPYGLEKNRATLEAFCRYANDQGVASRRLLPEELFPVETLSSVKV